MEIIQLCELKDYYGYAGFCFSDNQYYQFRITDNYRFLKRFKYMKSFEGHSNLLKLLNAKTGAKRYSPTFVEIPQLTLEELELAAARMPPNSMDCSWTLSRLPDIQHHETILDSQL